MYHGTAAPHGKGKGSYLFVRDCIKREAALLRRSVEHLPKQNASSSSLCVCVFKAPRTYTPVLGALVGLPRPAGSGMTRGCRLAYLYLQIII